MAASRSLADGPSGATHAVGAHLWRALLEGPGAQAAPHRPEAAQAREALVRLPGLQGTKVAGVGLPKRRPLARRHTANAATRRGRA